MKRVKNITNLDIDEWLQRQFQELKENNIELLHKYEAELKNVLSYNDIDIYECRYGIGSYKKRISFLEKQIVSYTIQSQDEYIWRIVNKKKKFFRRILTHRDNKTCLNYGNYDCKFSIRVPSLKRGTNTWKRFYQLFPFLKGQETYAGCKLKKI